MAIVTIICTVVMLSFTNSRVNSSKFACTWFFFDDPAIIDPAIDYPSSTAQALTQGNYRIATAGDLVQCSGALKICTICANPDPANTTKPLLTIGEPVVTQILKYFGPPPYVNNINLIRMKFF